MDELESHDLDALLRDAETFSGATDDDESVFSDAWSRVQASMCDDGASFSDTAQQRPLNPVHDRALSRRPRRRAARLTAAAVAVVVVGSGTAAAAATFLSTRTGEHTSGWQVDAGGSGELLNTGGTDRPQVFSEVTADIPFAPGYEIQRVWALEFFPGETDSVLSEESLRSWIAGNAVCTWADAWVAADNAGDGEARAAATAHLTEAVSWKDIVESDFPDAIILDSGEHLSYRWWVRSLADAARAGDRAALLDTLAQSTGCSYHVLPVIDVAPDYVMAGAR